MTIEELNKYAGQEASWLQYYGISETRKSDPYNDAKFYDRVLDIGSISYAKRIPLPLRCAACGLTSKRPVLESTVEELEITSGPRKHDDNIYTPLEYVLATKFEGSEKIIATLQS